MTKKVMGLIAALAAVGGLIGVISIASAAASAVSIESATVEPNAAVTVNLTADATADDGTLDGTAGDGIGAFEIRVVYDKALLNGAAPTCTAGSDPQWEIKVCNAAYDDPLTVPVEDNIVFFTGAASNGAAGTGINLGAITFTAGATEGMAALDVQIDLMTDPTDADLASGITPTDGTITIAQATPTPSPSPSPVPATDTPTPTASPAALPPTGGTSSDGSGSGIAWVLGALGLAVLAGGVWVVSRTRRHSV